MLLLFACCVWQHGEAARQLYALVAVLIRFILCTAQQYLVYSGLQVYGYLPSELFLVALILFVLSWVGCVGGW